MVYLSAQLCCRSPGSCSWFGHATKRKAWRWSGKAAELRYFAVFNAPAMTKRFTQSLARACTHKSAFCKRGSVSGDEHITSAERIKPDTRETSHERKAWALLAVGFQDR